MSNYVPLLDTNWLWAVLRYAKTNPDLFPDVAEGCYSLDENDVEDIATFYNTDTTPQ